MDYGFFDALIDSVFVIDGDRCVVYCNEAAAKLCESSVKRLTRKKPIYETIEFSDTNLFVMPSGKTGEKEPAPYVEINYKLKSGKQGKVQIAIQPFADPQGVPLWAVMIHDVTVEEVLHAKHHQQLAQLEAYSKNLEHMVEERTQEVKRANIMLNAIMNSLGQGFFVFDDKGICADFYTRACESILEGKPAGQHVASVLRVPEKEKNTFKMWMESSFKELLPFDSMKELGPKLFPHSGNHHIQLDYYPLRDDSSKIKKIVVVATDQTAEYRAQRALEKEKRFAKMVIKLVTSKRQFSEFIASAGKTIEQLLKEIKSASKESFDHEATFRALHTLEGEAATYSVVDLWQSSRTPQEVIEPIKRGEIYDWHSLKLTFEKSLVDLQDVYRQFLDKNKDLFQLVGIGSRKIEIDKSVIEGVLLILRMRNTSESVCGEIEDLLLKESVVNALRHYDDVVAVVAEKLNKKVAPIQFFGDDVRVFLDDYQTLFATFVHAFRNLVDHGIEPADEREMIGKSATGNVKVFVERFKSGVASWLRIAITDDGRGVSVTRMKEKIKQAEPNVNVDSLDEEKLVQYVFASGITTKEEVGEFSGRGIGMNAIKVEAEKMGGSVWVENREGQGMKLVIEVPDLDRVANMKQSA